MTDINILPAIEQLRELSAWGWSIQVDVSADASKGIVSGALQPQLVGLTARRDVPGGTCTISVRISKQSETIETLAKDLLDLCSGFRVKR